MKWFFGLLVLISLGDVVYDMVFGSIEYFTLVSAITLGLSAVGVGVIEGREKRA